MAEPHGRERAPGRIPGEATERPRWGRARDLAGLIVSWGTWAALTVALLAYVREYARNVPYMDDFEMVPVMTGAEPVSLRWAWAQHNEHRPLISRLILAGLSRYVSSDFRVPRYANALLLSATAAGMLWLVRRVRGSSRLTDAVLPLAILNIAQAESLMIGFAMNLILSTMAAAGLIAAAALSHRADDRGTAVGFGLALVLLPLGGGSGLVMVPPLAAWLAGYAARGWWSGRRPGRLASAIGLGLLAAGLLVVGLYLWGYQRPAHHPLPPSARAVASATLMELSLAIYPRLTSYGRPAGLLAAALVAATLGLLAVASLRTPRERPRAVGLMAIILAMLCVAGAVGVSRAGLGPGAILASRYVTLSTPLLCALYLAWLAYGRPIARAIVHTALLASIAATIPDACRFTRHYGLAIKAAERRVERGIELRLPREQLLGWACPHIYPDPRVARDCFRMLKAARIGAFADYDDGRVASAPTVGAIRR